MKIDVLRARNLRCFERIEFAPGGGLNWLVGPNGAGKTTVLEAAHLLSHGRSFRAGGRSAPCRHGSDEYLIYAELSREGRPAQRAGLARTEDRWRARVDGMDLDSLAPLFAASPVVYFGPESQGLIVGPAEERRSFLDWSVFHVEHESLDLWRAWRRTLRQRNALLRADADDRQFAPWEQALARLAERIHAMRAACLASLEPFFSAEAAWLVPELGALRIEYRPGWDEQAGLERQLLEHRVRDRERGFTHPGPHRADWGLRFEHVARRDHLSRGQAKATALVCMLAQARWLKERLGDYPLLCLDDLVAELDAAHVAKVIDWLEAKPLQAWLTSTGTPPEAGRQGESGVFHVEHAGIKLV
ncbi:MAG: DNA replication/repair protein RecF [Rhodanobacteraceae bacterium]